MTEVTVNTGFDVLPLGSSAIIVSIHLPEDDPSGVTDLNELASLLKTLGIPVVAKVNQNRQKLTPHSLVGKGKALEIKQLAIESGADMVVFDRPLSGPQVKNLESITCCAVTDRTGIILEIFSRHAQTKQAKTQVEIARLEYAMSRFTGAWTHFQRQKGGGVRSRGMGETQIEIDRRRTRERISKLQQKLKQIEIEYDNRRKQRSQEWKVALVGYTNSGKTTLMKGLSRTNIEGRDELFATLDTQVRSIDPQTRPKILVTDTVGFIRNLPHGLVESFRSTLAEVAHAQLIVHVVDVSHECYRQQMATTEQVLKEIGASDIPTLICFNKLDQLDDAMLPRILRGVYSQSTVISGVNLNDIEMLRDKIIHYFRAKLMEVTLEIPLEDVGGQSQVFAQCLVLDSDYSDPKSVRITVKAPEAVLNRMRQYQQCSPSLSPSPVKCVN